MLICAIDPGTERSGWIIFQTGIKSYPKGKIKDYGISYNEHLLSDLMTMTAAEKSQMELVIERIMNYGRRAVGMALFESAVWTGRFMQAWGDQKTVTRIDRPKIKSFLLGKQSGNNKEVRRACIDFFGEGRPDKYVIGTKRKPGVLFGINDHTWSALALALTHVYRQRNDAPDLLQEALR